MSTHPMLMKMKKGLIDLFRIKNCFKIEWQLKKWETTYGNIRRKDTIFPFLLDSCKSHLRNYPFFNIYFTTCLSGQQFLYIFRSKLEHGHLYRNRNTTFSSSHISQWQIKMFIYYLDCFPEQISFLLYYYFDSFRKIESNKLNKMGSQMRGLCTFIPFIPANEFQCYEMLIKAS